MNNRTQGFAQYIALAVVGVLAVGAVVISSVKNLQGNSVNGAVLSEATSEFTVATSTAIANQDGSTVTVGAQKAWIGNAQSATLSYLGMVFTGGSIPSGAEIKSATIDLTAVGAWISVGTTIYGDTSNSISFSSGTKLSTLPLTTQKNSYSDNVNWPANSTQSYDVTAAVKELYQNSSTPKNAFVLIAKGTGGSYGRKEIYGSPATGKSPRLRVVYSSGTGTTSGGGSGGGTTSSTPTATPVVTASPTASPRATTTPTSSPTPTATVMPTMSMNPTATPAGTTSTGSTIYGVVSADILGTCPASVHDRYITTGPDGKVYRTWHPSTVPVDANNPNGAKCAFAHEHGADPSTSNIFRGAVPFDYIPAQISMDEPHAGFKCFVQNKGTKNDEGSIALHDSYFCFHMGTGGAARFTTRFHSIDFHIMTANGQRMDLAGMADTGNVGTICSDPRQGRTVMGYGCKLDSAYEIWENKLNIVNKGNTVATAVTSTAVFDPITVMNPADLTQAVSVWDPITNAQIFKFADPRSSYRGCERESYTGPLMWYNANGAQVYYTDVYGNVVNNGPIKQYISNINTDRAGSLTQFGGFVMTSKGGLDPQTQFKYRSSYCAAGLGVKN